MPEAPDSHSRQPRAGNEQPRDRLLVDEPEAARLLGISPRTLWSLRHEHQIPWVRIGRRVLYAVSDLLAWIEMRKTK